MAVSVFDLFKIGIGPSSSHTVGPMRAARMFALQLRDEGKLDRLARLKVELFGSLGATGKGHGSDKAILLGLMGETPEGVDVESIPSRVARWASEGRVPVLGQREVPFREGEHLVLHRRRSLPFHPNGMRFSAWDAAGAELAVRIYYSVGGGFVVNESAAPGESPLREDKTPV